jgi:hypothetical protein
MTIRVAKPRKWVPQTFSVRFTVAVPVRVVSESNTRGHWTARHRRSVEQATAVGVALLPLGGAVTAAAYLLQTGGTATVTLTRLGGRALDSDNLTGAFKAIRDKVARRLGIDDGSPRLCWQYAQHTGGVCGVIVDVLTEAAAR